MGVKNLWEILDSCKKTLPLNHLQNKRLCIDLSCWIVQFQNASRNPAFAKEKAYLSSLFHRLRALIALNCSLIFVTDGSIPAIKLSTYRQRLGSGREVSRDESNLQGLSSQPRNMGSLFSSMIKEAKVLGMALGIPCINGIEEAEAQCALLNSESLCDGCFSADSDIFLFGARTVYKDIYLGEGGYIVCYEMSDVERKLGFGRNSLISFALLLGSDYFPGVQGIGPDTACQIIKSAGNDLILQRIASEVAIVKKTRGSKKQGRVITSNVSKENLADKQNGNGGQIKLLGLDSLLDSVQTAGLNNHFLKVIDAYLNPKCHSPDSEVVQSVLVPHPFQRNQLQSICTEFFGWTPEKTDEYILPKTAERDLRRFANLRNKGQELGVHVPLNKMCARCPVSTILQKRKIQGKDFFEVAWNGIDGLKTSTLPADLVQSACPEKIAEYEERRGEVKQAKRKRKPPKAACKPQAHLPSTELNTHDAACLNVAGPSTETNLIDLSTPSPPIRACKTSRYQQLRASDLDVQLRGLLLNTESQANDVVDTSLCKDSVAPSTVESVVIDLSTPLPPPQVGTRSGKTVEGRMDVIDLSDLEDNFSPEHVRKARELRLFLNSVKNDLY